jgi:hypothetical protein
MKNTNKLITKSVPVVFALLLSIVGLMFAGTVACWILIVMYAHPA